MRDRQSSGGFCAENVNGQYPRKHKSESPENTSTENKERRNGSSYMTQYGDQIVADTPFGEVGSVLSICLFLPLPLRLLRNTGLVVGGRLAIVVAAAMMRAWRFPLAKRGLLPELESHTLEKGRTVYL